MSGRIPSRFAILLHWIEVRRDAGCQFPLFYEE